MSGNSFFDEQSQQSQIKSAIVAKYFNAWSKVIISVQKKHPDLSSGKIAYIDLFAGPGRYKDGSQSTPVKVLEKAISNKDLRERLVTIFNDKDERNSESLKEAIKRIPGLSALKYQPTIRTEEVGERIVSMFESMTLIPTLFFVDPWGYKGLSLRLVNCVLKDWGCDCIFFFNYNRINMGLGNPFVREHMDALFGKKCAETLREKVENLSPENRELVIVEELCQVIHKYGNRYVLPFRFRNNSGNRTSHHLIFVSKNIVGYEIMKEIMAKESSSFVDGVAGFEYSPADFLPKQALLFQLSRPLEDLKDDLLRCFAGQTLKMVDIYRNHHVDTPYIKQNYKKALNDLENIGEIQVAKHRKNTFGDNIVVSFKKRS